MNFKLCALLGLAGAMTSSAWAQAPGTFLIRGGAMKITPKVESSPLSAPAPQGTTIDNGPSTKPAGGITLMLTPNISVDIPLAPPFKFPIYGTGAIQGVGQIGSVKSLPATQFLQYRFGEQKSTIRPYVGLGITYAKFFGEESSAAFTGLTNPGGPVTSFKVQSKFAFTPQVGLYVDLSETYFFDIWYAKTFLKNKTTLSTGQTQENVLNPRTLSIGIDMKL